MSQRSAPMAGVVVAATLAQVCACALIVFRADNARLADARVARALGAALAIPASACALVVLAPTEWSDGVFFDTPTLWWTTLLAPLGALIHLHISRAPRKDTAKGDKGDKGDDAGTSRAINLLMTFGALTAIIAPTRKTPHASTTRLVTGAIACALANAVVLRDARAVDGFGLIACAMAHALGHVACALVLVALAFEAGQGPMGGGGAPSEDER